MPRRPGDVPKGPPDCTAGEVAARPRQIVQRGGRNRPQRVGLGEEVLASRKAGSAGPVGGASARLGKKADSLSWGSPGEEREIRARWPEVEHRGRPGADPSTS